MVSPMELKYMRMTRRALRHLDAWPHAQFGERRHVPLIRHHRFLFCLWTVSTTLQILYIRENLNKLNFVEMGHNYITTLLSIVCVQRITMPSMKSYCELIKMFVLEMHLLHHKHKSQYAMKVNRQVKRICTFFCYLSYTEVAACVMFFNITVLINNYRNGMFSSHRPENGTFELSAYYKLPFDYQHNFLGYLGVLIYNTIVTIDVGCAFIFFDFFLLVIVFHTWGHLKILEHNLRNFPRPEMRPQEGGSSYLENPPWYTSEESERVAQLLKENIDHHRLLMNFVDKTSSAFGPTLCVLYAYQQVSGCILLLECSTMDPEAFSEYFPTTLYSFQQLIQLSIVFELIGSKSEALTDAVYSVPWECMRRSERRTLLIFLCNVQTPISLKAMGLVPVGVRTMATVLKTTLSYFLMLRTLAKK